MSAPAIQAAFVQQAVWCRAIAAPVTAVLCEAGGQVVGDGSALGQRLSAWPGDPVADALVLRVIGGLHALVRAGALPDLAALLPPNPHRGDDEIRAAALAALRAHADALLPWPDSAPQTNEVGRSGPLMAGLLAVAAATGERPMRLLELGCSAGLNLRLDAYAYDLGGLRYGPANAPLTLAPLWDGPPPPAARVRIASRRGVDLNPLDVRRDAERMLAYVWIDQPGRLARMAAATAAAALDPPPIDRAEASGLLAGQLATPPEPGVTRVVMHSVALQYFPAAARARVLGLLADAGARDPGHPARAS